MSANFFLLMGRAVGSLFTVRNGQTYSVGDTVPMYDTNPTARNSRAKRVATARYVEDCGTQAKYDFQPSRSKDSPRHFVPLPRRREGSQP